jgi:hypothetical protein
MSPTADTTTRYPWHLLTAMALPHRFLTDKGIEYLREYLALPQEIVPATLKKTARPAGERPRPAGDRPPRRFDGPREGGGGFGRDREGYRSGAPREGGGGFGRGGDKVGVLTGAAKCDVWWTDAAC